MSFFFSSERKPPLSVFTALPADVCVGSGVCGNQRHKGGATFSGEGDPVRGRRRSRPHSCCPWEDERSSPRGYANARPRFFSKASGSLSLRVHTHTSPPRGTHDWQRCSRADASSQPGRLLRCACAPAFVLSTPGVCRKKERAPGSLASGPRSWKRVRRVVTRDARSAAKAARAAASPGTRSCRVPRSLA